MSSQESIGLDPVFYPQLNVVTRIYIFFALAALVVAVVRLVHLWIAAPPFRLKRKTQDPAYLNLLERWRISTRQWISCAILGWALVVSSDLSSLGMRITESKTIGAIIVLSEIREIGVSSSFAALICLRPVAYAQSQPAPEGLCNSKVID